MSTKKSQKKSESKGVKRKESVNSAEEGVKTYNIAGSNETIKIGGSATVTNVEKAHHFGKLGTIVTIICPNNADDTLIWMTHEKWILVSISDKLNVGGGVGRIAALFRSD